MTKIQGHLGKVLEEKATERISFDKEGNCTHEVKCGNTWMTLEQMGARIAELRKTWGMSQQELAEASGVSRWTITQFEQGKQNISTDKLIRLGDALQAQIIIKLKAEE